MKLDTALTLLKSGPVPFLGAHLLAMAGSSQSQVYSYYFSHHQAPGHHTGMGEYFKFDTIPPAGGMGAITGGDNKLYTKMNVHNVRMNPNSEALDISAIPAYVLDGGGPDVMITGQLSACIFAIRQEPGRLLVAHIQPGGGRQTGTMLRQTIKLMGHLIVPGGGGRVTQVFGMPDYPAKAYVVGLRTGGMWHIYAQCVASANGPITNSLMIV
jgi:hypothetical protein